jgi:F1F0 ATPase subunit 2
MMMMAMNEFSKLVFSLTPALLEGILLGLFFFIGLWLTVRKLDSTKSAAFLFLGSMLLRTIIVILGFYFILGDDWQRLLVGLVGFIIARIIVTRFIRIKNSSNSSLQKTGHES